MHPNLGSVRLREAFLRPRLFDDLWLSAQPAKKRGLPAHYDVLRAPKMRSGSRLTFSLCGTCPMHAGEREGERHSKPGIS